jgi:hypothetical protein
MHSHSSGLLHAFKLKGKTSDIRTSSGMFFGLGETPVVHRIEERIARWSMTAIEQGEGIQVLRYEVNCGANKQLWPCIFDVS